VVDLGFLAIGVANLAQGGLVGDAQDLVRVDLEAEKGHGSEFLGIC
jgi:hypothetical protein